MSEVNVTKSAIYCSRLYTVYRLCSRLTALWRYINFVLLLLLVYARKAKRRTLYLYRGWPKKVSHYHESSLNRIKTHHKSWICHQFRPHNAHKNMIRLY